jgi:hypothetical protein
MALHPDIEKDLRRAIRHFWKTREKQAKTKAPEPAPAMPAQERPSPADAKWTDSST